MKRKKFLNNFKNILTKNLDFFIIIHYNSQGRYAEMSERPKEHDWKSCVRATVPGVRIPISAP